jgi:RimJ/RimL family protein N-acetyltransferase
MEPLSFRPLTAADRAAALAVINEAARWYAEFLPPEALHGPEMTLEDFDTEGRRMTWYGAFVSGQLVAVMGLEHVKDAALIRHGYVPPAWQRQGVGSALLAHLEGQARAARIVIGTYAANYKARAVLEKQGYRLSESSEAVLREYFAIPEDRLKTSVTYEKARGEGRGSRI